MAGGVRGRGVCMACMVGGVCMAGGGIRGMHGGGGVCMAGGGIRGRRCAWHAWWGCAWQEGASVACMVGGCAWQEGVSVMGGRAWQILRDTVNERAVRILLECILVITGFCF